MQRSYPPCVIQPEPQLPPSGMPEEIWSQLNPPLVDLYANGVFPEVWINPYIVEGEEFEIEICILKIELADGRPVLLCDQVIPPSNETQNPPDVTPPPAAA